MNCADIRRKLSAYIDDELSLRERQLIKEHLDLCLHCAEEEKQLLLLSSLMDMASDDVVSSSFTIKAVNNIRSRRNESFAVPFFRPVMTGFIIIVFLLAGIAGFNSRSNGDANTCEELRDFDDFPPGSFARIFMNTVREK